MPGRSGHRPFTQIWGMSAALSVIHKRDRRSVRSRARVDRVRFTVRGRKSIGQVQNTLRSEATASCGTRTSGPTGWRPGSV